MPASSRCQRCPATSQVNRPMPLKWFKWFQPRAVRSAASCPSLKINSAIVQRTQRFYCGMTHGLVSPRCSAAHTKTPQPHHGPQHETMVSCSALYSQGLQGSRVGFHCRCSRHPSIPLRSQKAFLGPGNGSWRTESFGASSASVAYLAIDLA
jgi:hypothetical protein